MDYESHARGRAESSGEKNGHDFSVCALVIVFYTRGDPLHLPKEVTGIEHHDWFCFAPSFCLDEVQ